MSHVFLHQILLTAAERRFVAAVLEKAAGQRNSNVGSAAALIAATPPQADGMFNIVLSEPAREAVFIAGSYLANLGFRPEHLKRYTNSPKEKPAGGWAEAGRRLFRMFGPCVIDRDHVYRTFDSFSREPHFAHDEPLRFEKVKDWYSARALFEVFYRNEWVGLQQQSANVRRRIAREALAFAICEVAHLATLRTDPKVRDGRIRIHIDWASDMWLPPKERRSHDVVPDTWLDSIEDDELAALAP